MLGFLHAKKTKRITNAAIAGIFVGLQLPLAVLVSSPAAALGNPHDTPVEDTGSLTISKSAPDDTNKQFDFTSNIDKNAKFNLKDGQSNNMTGLTLDQTYTVTETEPDGWSLGSINCGEANVDTSTPGSVSVTLSSDQKDVTCTFNNVQDTFKKITICHRTDSVLNPYVTETVDFNAATGVLQDNGNGDHSTHTGPLAASQSAAQLLKNSKTKWGDIIPSYTWTGKNPGTYPGLNYTVDGQAILNNDCKYVSPTGSITIVKSADPVTDQSFDFTSTLPDNGSFSLSGDGVVADDTNAVSGLALNQTYTVTEGTEPLGWALSNIDCGDARVTPNFDNQSVSVTLNSDQTDVTCTFNNFQPGQGGDTFSVSGFKFEDHNNNGAFDNGEAKLPGWTVTLYASDGEGGWTTVDSTTTDQSGNYSFTGLEDGNYKVCETQQSGWTQTFPSDNSGCDLFSIDGESVDGQNFGNFQLGSVSGFKFNDANGNGQFDGNEVKLSGWTINLEDGQGKVLQTTQTDSNGNYSFTNLAAGNYKVCEVQQSGWTQKLGGTDNGCYDLTVATSGQTFTANFGNQQNAGTVLGISTVVGGRGGQVLGASTTLADTGSPVPVIVSILAGLSVLGIVAALSQASRRRQLS